VIRFVSFRFVWTREETAAAAAARIASTSLFRFFQRQDLSKTA